MGRQENHVDSDKMAKLSNQAKKPSKIATQTKNGNTEKDVSPQGKFVKAPRPLLQLNKDGGIIKSKKPVSKAIEEASKKARMAIATGELNQDELKRKTERDLRTLYVRFKNSTTAPATERDIYKLDKLIKDVRIPRQAKKTLNYCFMEFSDEKVCEAMKNKLAANPDLMVDFVGVKSKSRTTGTTKKRPINPTRLHVSGFSQGITSEKLKALFPKCSGASVPPACKNKTAYGFVQFSNPADAKAAFDATQKLKVGDNQHITVIFARLQKHGSVVSGRGENKKDKTKKAEVEEKEAEKETAEDSDEDNDKNDGEEEAEDSNEEGDEEGDEEIANDEESDDDEDNEAEAEAEESDEAEENEEDSDDEEVENDNDDSEGDDDDDDDE